MPRPKRGATPREFYLDYLPSLWRALVGDAKVTASDIAIAVHLGAAGQFVTALENGALVTLEGTSATALAVFDSDVDSWRIAVLELAPRLLKRAEAQFDTLRVAERIGKLKLGALPPGVLTVIYEDDAGDSATVRIRVSGGGPREARIEANDTELWKLLDGGGKLSQIVTSRVRISGDVTYVLDLARQLEI